MISYIRALGILIKRALCKPFTAILVLLIPLSAILIQLIPQNDMSTTIETGIYIENPDSYTDALTDKLTKEKEGFVFVICESKEELINKVSSGILDCGFALPDGYADTFINGKTKDKLTMYTSPSSMFQYIAMEKLYGCMLEIYAPQMTTQFISENFGEAYDDYITERFEKYLNDNSVFTISVTGNQHFTASKQRLNTFPIYELTGLLIFICSLFGVLNYLRDESRHSYDSLSNEKKHIYCIINIAAEVLPAAIIGYITLMIYNSSINAFKLLLHMLLYMLICILYSLLYRLLFRKYTVYQAVLPIIITLALLLTPTFINVTEYIPALKYLSMLFAPYFF